MKLTRRTAATGVCAAITGGVLLAGGGPALAAAPATAGHTTVHSAAADTARDHTARHHTGRRVTDPWIAGQLATFCPSHAQRAAVFDPWIKDQLAQFGLDAR